MRKIFTEEQEEFFIRHQKGLLLQESADLMNRTFGLHLTATQVRDQRSRLGVKGGKFFIPHPSRRLFTAEQREFFVKHQQGMLRQELADLMNERFGLQITARQVKEQRTTMKLHGGDRMLYSKRIRKNDGMFAKGNRPYNYLPVGSEVVKDDGYLWRKIGEPNRWKQVHILLWEAAHGPRGKGEKIIFLNGDRRDIRLENLAKVSNAEMLYLNRKELIFAEKELTEAGVAAARLFTAAREFELKKRRKRMVKHEQ